MCCSTRDGRVKLADFGLAKFSDCHQDLTRTGAAIGTVAYMSPEQAGGGDVGMTSDVYSFGVLVYELLTGERPFKGDSPGAVIGALLAGRHVPVGDQRKGLPADLSAVVERCLSHDPRGRFGSGQGLLDALRLALSEDVHSRRFCTLGQDRRPAARGSTSRRSGHPLLHDVRWRVARGLGGRIRSVHRPRPRLLHASRDGVGAA